jgi:glucose/mannose transport system substrate-binding protein
MKVKGVVLAACVAAIAAVYPTSAAEPAAGTKEGSKGVTLLHWWTSPSELAAINAVGDVFKRRNPTIPLNITDVPSHGGGAGFFLVAKSAAAAHTPPDAIHVNIGAPLRPYLDAGLLSPIDDLWKTEGLERVVPPMIRAMSRVDGHYYALPIDVHRNNLVWYNKRLLDKYGIDPATLTTWDSFFEAADKLKAAGVRYPLQLGAPWTLSVSFEGIMAGLGAQHYDDWVNGRITATDDPRLLEAFGILKRYVSYATPEYASMEWDVAIQRIIKGDAAFCIMGDWANGEFRLAKMAFGRDYGAVPLPGTQGMYAAAVDTFVQGRGTVSPANTARLTRVIASREGQDAFNVRKGSISPRTDADLSRYDAYQRSAMADFKAAKVIYPNVVASTHDAFNIGLVAIMGTFQSDLDVKKAAAAVAMLASRSQNKFSHVWSLKQS